MELFIIAALFSLLVLQELTHARERRELQDRLLLYTDPERYQLQETNRIALRQARHAAAPINLPLEIPDAEPGQQVNQFPAGVR